MAGRCPVALHSVCNSCADCLGLRRQVRSSQRTAERTGSYTSHRFPPRIRGGPNGSRGCVPGASMSARASTSSPQSGHFAGSGNRTSMANRVRQPRHCPDTVSRRCGDAAGRRAPSSRRELTSPPSGARRDGVHEHSQAAQGSSGPLCGRSGIAPALEVLDRRPHLRAVPSRPVVVAGCGSGSCSGRRTTRRHHRAGDQQSAKIALTHLRYPPSFGFPPVELCRGTRPNQAAKSDRAVGLRQDVLVQ